MTENEISLESLYKIAFENTIPLSATIEVLNACNLRCEHCYIPAHTSNGLSSERIISLLDELKELGTLELLLTGGEIFLRKDIMQIIRHARKIGMSVTLFTNATLVNYEQLQELAELHISEFSCSIYSMNPDIHDSITGQPGSLEKTLRNMKYAKDLGIRCGVKTVVMKKNYTEWKPILAYCEENGFDFVAPANIMPRTNGDIAPLQFQLDYAQIKQLYREESEYGLEEQLSSEPWNGEDYICNKIHYSVYIQCNGNVYPCNSFYFKIGNVTEQRMSEIWNTTKDHRYLLSLKKKNMHACSSCDYKQFCVNCPGSSLMANGDMFSCNETDYNNAKIAKEVNA